MKFPKFTELDKEQRAIYNGAPPVESILVMGPPGTGKTVMAFFRAALLQNMHAKNGSAATRPRVIMFNKVLAKYTSKREEGVADGVPCSTMHQWAWHWYRGITRTTPPALPGNEFLHDWMGMLPQLLEKAVNTPAKVNWGHLVVDEGQDFPPVMYQVLSMVAGAVNDSGGSPALTVFADDNQRINGSTNSTLDQIEQAMSLKKERVYRLSKNYRNSKQIAEFARHYYVGLKSGIPDLPTRVGRSLPRVVLTSSLEVVRRRISIFASNNPGLDIGVLCARDAERKKVFNSLHHRLNGTGIVVQTYSYKDREEHPPEDLVFDKGGSVTVLNFQSAKGLEFDAVFIIDPFVEGAGAVDVQSKMQLYVMASRARDYLELLLMNPPANLANYLPSKELYEQSQE
jgi:DNA helicase II / ATP-dependent DNA helicase PcrA